MLKGPFQGPFFVGVDVVNQWGSSWHPLYMNRGSVTLRL
jgi:hypothetical protein